jgi:hypothetical protein
MGFKKLKNEPFQSAMSTGQAIYAINGNVSHILTPMANTDIKRCEKTGDWSELLEKAQANTRRFRREFYR